MAQSRIYKIKRFITVNTRIEHGVFYLECWMSPVNVWGMFEVTHPYKYTSVIDDEEIVIQANHELTQKMIAMVAENSEVIINQQVEINNKRLAVNR